MDPIFFYIFASITVLMVVMMIFQKNPISSAVCLVVSFFSLAALYATLSAHFVAILQILIYAGAIMVLFIFVIMLLNLKKDELTREKFNLNRFGVVILGLGLFAFFAIEFLKIPTVAFPKINADFGTAQSVGKLMFSEYVVPFEMIGILLLVGIVGAVLLGRRES